MTNYVCGFFVSGNTLSLIKKNKPEWQKGKLNGLGGKIEEGETSQEAMQREFREEAGLDIPASSWKHRITLKGKDFCVHFFVAFEWHLDKSYSEYMVTSNCSEGEIAYYPFSTIHAQPDLIPNLRWIIPFCLQTQFSPIEVEDKG